MEAVIDLVLDWVESPRDYVMLCTVNKDLWRIRRKTLLALSAVRGFDQYARVESTKLTQEHLQGLSQIMRFYGLCERLTLEVNHSQTESVNGIPRLQKKWREVLRDVVNEFFRQVKGMHSCDSFVHLDCKNKWDLLDAKSAWEWITDDDMIIFGKCHNLAMTFLTQVTDKGLEYLTSIRVLQIHFSRHITGASMKMLHLHHKLWCLNLLDDKNESRYAPEIVTFFRSRQPRFYFRFYLC